MGILSHRYVVKDESMSEYRAGAVLDGCIKWVCGLANAGEGGCGLP